MSAGERKRKTLIHRSPDPVMRAVRKSLYALIDLAYVFHPGEDEAERWASFRKLVHKTLDRQLDRYAETHGAGQ